MNNLTEKEQLILKTLIEDKMEIFANRQKNAKDIKEYTEAMKKFEEYAIIRNKIVNQ